MTKREILKKIAIGLLTLVVLTGLLLFIFRDNIDDISAAFKKLSVSKILCLICLGTAYQLLDGLGLYRLMKNVQPSFRYRQAVGVVYLGVFTRISTFAAGTIPIQTYYLHRCQVEVGRGFGILALKYAFHKTSVVLFTTLLLLLGGHWLHTAVSDIHNYLIGGYCICFFIILILVLLCTWKRAHQFALWLLSKLPSNGKWAARTEKIRKQLDVLYVETTACLKNKKLPLSIFLIDFVKLSIFCSVPFVCTRFLGDSTISFFHTELLTALMLLIASAVPNIAGMGPTEIVYYIMYHGLLGTALASSSLILFRITTYYLPFLISIFNFLNIQMQLVYKKEKATSP